MSMPAMMAEVSLLIPMIELVTMLMIAPLLLYTKILNEIEKA